MSIPQKDRQGTSRAAATCVPVADRIRTKIADYKRYAFTRQQTCAFNVFFDLAQELDTLEELHALVVLLLMEFFEMPAEFYTLDASGKLIRCSPGLGPVTPTPPVAAELETAPSAFENEYRIPVRGRKEDLFALPLVPVADALGILILHPGRALTAHECLYYEKFANRLGFQLHNKLLYTKNSEHIRFIRNLVNDIGHNVIVPNMYFKLLFRQLEGKIQAMTQVRETLAQESTEHAGALGEAMHQLGYLHDRLEEQYREIYRHFQQSSLFLETLLRQSHFDQGHYVLQKSTIDLTRRIVLPQLDRFSSRLEEKHITVLPVEYDKDACHMILADVGLLSQVLANLLSNAVKYTRPSPEDGSQFVGCRVLRNANAFGPGKDAARIEVRTSGPLINSGEAAHLFEADFRGSNTDGEYGTGHGLHFVREIVELHGGHTGYRRDEDANVFWLEIPCEEPVS